MDKYADQYQIQKIIDTYIPVSYQGLCNKESAEHIQQIQLYLTFEKGPG